MSARPPGTDPFLLVLGTAQDGGVPQAGCRRACCAAARRDPSRRRLDPSRRRLVSSIAIVEPDPGRAWILDATPDFRDQLVALEPFGLAGILLTHGHVGHYLGLAQLGREVMGARDVPVYAMARMAALLRTSAPWEQLVRLGQIELRAMDGGLPFALTGTDNGSPGMPRIRVTAFPVLHRGEYTETVGFRIEGPSRSAVYLPDIDGWEASDGGIAPGLRLEGLVRSADALWLDGTFFDDREISHRNPAEIPHPRIADTLRLVSGLPAEERAKIRFTHLNHTNPVLDPASDAAAFVGQSGCSIAVEGERFGL